MTKTYKNDRDANEREIINALRAAGCYVQQMDRKDGFDLLVASPRNGVHIIEVKNPLRNWQLTDSEYKLSKELESRDISYWIIETITEALQIV